MKGLDKTKWIVDLRILKVEGTLDTYTIEYKTDDEWFNLFEDVTNYLCELIVEVLKEKLLDS